MPLSTSMSSAGASNRRIGVLSTYPPELCGLATFAAALGGALHRAGHRVDVVRIDGGGGPQPLVPPIVAELVNGVAASVRNAARVLSRCDVAIVQHEYGIFGGPDGDEVVPLLRAIEVPTVVVLHTVPLVPTPHQKSVLEEVCDLADGVVVMADAAADRLIALYRVHSEKVAVIPHGASVPLLVPCADDEGSVDARPELLTWGLLGPGKGIEHVIDALALLAPTRPRLRYTVAGVTHPKVRLAHGDAYRHSLIQRTWANGIAGSVTFDDTYRDVAQLTRFVASSSLVVLPYDSRDQITSGVLVDAIAAGRPVIATAFPHAVELLATGAGIVVPHGDPRALADAIHLATSDVDAMDAMVGEARRLAPGLSWASVAMRYVGLADVLVQTRESVAG